MRSMIAVVLLALLRVAETYANPESDLLLAHKFSPILILTEETGDEWGDIRVIKPEPVEIVGADSAKNLWFEITGEKKSGTSTNTVTFRKVTWQSFSTWEPSLTIPNVNFSTNQFAFLPQSYEHTARATFPDAPAEFAGAFRHYCI